MTLQARVIRRFTIGGIVLAGLLFLPAGSLRYWQGWLFLVLTLGFLDRLIHEEKILRRDLPGYVDYCRQRRFRLVPGVW